MLSLVGLDVGRSADGCVCFELKGVRCWKVGVGSGVFFDTYVMCLDGVDGVCGSAPGVGVDVG